MNEIKHIHFVGVKGVGMTPLAIIAKEAGFTVSGCDITDAFITDQPLQKAGIIPLESFNAAHILTADLVVTTGAHGGFDNPEVKAAKEKGIPVWTQGEAVGKFMQGSLFHRLYKGISVAGCHGKTTTTAMLATIFSHADLDPSYIIGTSSIIPLGLPGHFGKGDYFIAEADEYANELQYDKTPKMLLQQPEIAIFTNIEFDHPDLYDSIDDTREVFEKMANNLPASGTIVAYGEDAQIQKILKIYLRKYITYGFNSKFDYFLHNIKKSSNGIQFTLSHKNNQFGELSLVLPGEHNALNATAAAIVSLHVGIKFEQIQKALASFRGTKRRFEYLGQLSSGALLFDDYAHHPTEINVTLASFREKFPSHKIICIFQPHTYSRTKSLFHQFLHAFKNADEVILTNIYASQREKPDETVSSEKLAKELKKIQSHVLFLPELINVIQYLNQKQPRVNTIIITMGAGDVYKIAESLI